MCSCRTNILYSCFNYAMTGLTHLDKYNEKNKLAHHRPGISTALYFPYIRKAVMLRSVTAGMKILNREIFFKIYLYQFFAIRQHTF